MVGEFGAIDMCDCKICRRTIEPDVTNICDPCYNTCFDIEDYDYKEVED